MKNIGFILKISGFNNESGVCSLELNLKTSFLVFHDMFKHDWCLDKFVVFYQYLDECTIYILEKDRDHVSSFF